MQVHVTPVRENRPKNTPEGPPQGPAARVPLAEPRKASAREGKEGAKENAAKESTGKESANAAAREAAPERVNKLRAPVPPTPTGDDDDAPSDDDAKPGLRISNPFSAMDDERLVTIRKLMGLAVLVFSVFLMVAFISHFFAGKEDQSVVEYGAVPPTTLPDKPANVGGTIGAFFSNLFITNGYGFIALLLPPYLFLLGYAILENTQWALVRRLTWLTFVALHWTAFCFGFLTILFGLQHTDWGGGLGLSLTEWVSFYIGLPGAGIVVLFTAVAFAVVQFNPRTDFLSFIPGFAGVHRPQTLEEITDDTADTDALPTAKVRRKKKADGKKEGEPAADDNSDETTLAGAQPIPAAEDEESMEGNFVVAIRKPTNDGTDTTTGESAPTPVAETGAAVVNDLVIPAKTDKPAKPAADVELVIAETTPADQTLPALDVAAADAAIDNIVQVEGDTYAKLVTPEDQEALEDDETVADWDAYDPTKELEHYKFPTLELLRTHETLGGGEVSRAELEENKNRIVSTLRNYNIEITSIKATVGPTVTLYEIVPAAGVRISKIKGLEDDIALSLAALGIRIIAPMPGKGTIGIEIPNSKPEIVSFRSLVATEKFRDTKAELPMAIGKTISNEVFVADLTRMPHLLVAGATQQGKSVGLNCIIASLLYKKHPAQLKFVLIDPKKVELPLFQLIEKHYLAKLPNYEDAVITDNKQVIHVLTSLCMEMDNRYQLLKTARVRNVAEYNAKFTARKLNPKKGHRFMPYIVLIIDELADLMMTAGKEVETPICRLAQLARATGIHLVIATQRPSVNVITGIIKANFPARMSYRVTSKIDSRTILDSNGAEQLIGRGDLLLSMGTELLRIQNAFIDTVEIESLVQFIGNQTGYSQPYFLPEVIEEAADEDDEPLETGEIDSLFDEAARLVVRTQSGSTSLIQRKMSIGYNRAGRIMDQLEQMRIVGAASGSKPRDVLVKDEAELEKILVNLHFPG
jgi:S-DNA-T family DNA segregation ATPase FtsK/SpoIIIE